MPSLYYAAFSNVFWGPVDRVKIILQTQRSNPYITPIDRYPGAIKAVATHIYQGGFQTLYRGNLVNTARLSLYRCYEYHILRYPEVFLPSSLTKQMAHDSVMRPVILGVSATLMMLIVQPLDVIWTLVGGQPHQQPKYSGLIHSTYKMMQANQLTHLYRGFIPNLLGYLIHKGSLYGAIGTVCMNEDITWDKTLLLTTLVPWAISYPFDTVARRMMIDLGSTEKKIGAIELAQQIFTKEGVAGFYQGGLLQYLRSSIGALFMAYSLSGFFPETVSKWSVE